MKSTIIVARNNENVSWVKNYNHFIVQKGEHLPNEGREPLSYIWYILNNYDTLEGQYIFCQADPFHGLRQAKEVFDNPQPGFNWYSDLIADTDLDGRPYDSGLEIDLFLKNCGLEPKSNHWLFPANCFFTIGAEQIKAKPKEFYERVFKALTMTKKAPWAFERVIDIIFGVKWK